MKTILCDVIAEPLPFKDNAALILCICIALVVAAAVILLVLQSKKKKKLQNYSIVSAPASGDCDDKAKTDD